MPSEMFGHKGRDEIIAVIIARLHANFGTLPNRGTLFDEQMRLKLRLEEIVSQALVDQQVGQSCTICQQSNAVIRASLRPVIAQIATQSLFTPRTI